VSEPTKQIEKFEKARKERTKGGFKSAGLFLPQHILEHGLDRRCAAYKMLRRVKAGLVDSLGADLTEAQEMLLRRVVYMEWKLRNFEALGLAGQGPSGDERYLAWAGTQDRLLRTLFPNGLQRQRVELDLGRALIKLHNEEKNGEP